MITHQEFVVYILWSSIHNKRYVGMTSSIISRFKSHNELATKGYTVKFRPWKVIHIEFFSSKSAALIREKELKTGKGREWMDTQINYS
jgi:putative endonuclease